jgi:hypothetical protein
MGSSHLNAKSVINTVTLPKIVPRMCLKRKKLKTMMINGRRLGKERTIIIIGFLPHNKNKDHQQQCFQVFLDLGNNLLNQGKVAT